MNRYLRYSLIVVGIVTLMITAGFYLQMSWATSLWPWPDGRLSYIFIASIFGAIGINVLWVALVSEWRATTGGALNLGIVFIGTAIFVLQLSSDRQNLLVYAVICLVLALVNFGIMIWSLRFAIRDSRATPRPVRISFLVFVAALIFAGAALALKSPYIFPWSVNPDSSVIFGWIFLGAAASFGYAFSRTRWHEARGQLLGFLIYDLILIFPFLGHFSSVESEHQLSLIIYTAVLVYSGALAAYYLFVNRETRTWAIQDAT